MVAPSLGCAASLAACWARASGVHDLPVSAAEAPITALRIKNDRRSTPAGTAVSGGARNGLSSCGIFGSLMRDTPGVCPVLGQAVCRKRRMPGADWELSSLTIGLL